MIVGCGTPAMTTKLVESHNWDNGLDQENLAQQSAANIKIYTAIPEGKYTILETRDSAYAYQKNSVTYKKVEKKKHLAKLRSDAGRCGANGVIVVFSDTPVDVGGGLEVDDYYGLEIIHSDDLSVVFVRSYAVYLQ